ncbi:hypothetical protein FRX31_026223 [Thalictrum thalictroides]|uniref:Uncharacterized protein n=1 Tax=Thalictrum thalictroides TaxID=46969 RepID=A0A7J6VGG3_THATH|nr:hypothetical protein FRX31_026223 [Thalictrum thalictroides]
MFMEETCIVKQILSMHNRQNKEEMVVPFAELCHVDDQKFEVTSMIPVEFREGFLYFALTILQILELMKKIYRGATARRTIGLYLVRTRKCACHFISMNEFGSMLLKFEAGKDTPYCWMKRRSIAISMTGGMTVPLKMLRDRNAALIEYHKLEDDVAAVNNLNGRH